jgi:hypothetical protein
MEVSRLQPMRLLLIPEQFDHPDWLCGRCAPCVATTLATRGNVNRNPLRVNPYYQSTDRSIALATFHPKSNIDAREQRWSWPSRLQSQRVAPRSTNANCRYQAQSHDTLSSS